MLASTVEDALDIEAHCQALNTSKRSEVRKGQVVRAELQASSPTTNLEINHIFQNMMILLQSHRSDLATELSTPQMQQLSSVYKT